MALGFPRQDADERINRPDSLITVAKFVSFSSGAGIGHQMAGAPAGQI